FRGIEISILYAGRIVAGITGATGAVAGAYIADITDGEDRARHFGLMSACIGVGMVAGPVAGGLLGAISLHAPFLAAAVLNGLNLLLGCFLMQESHKGERRDPGHHRMAQNLSRYGMIAPG
ncbi:MFS transporter, partial [Escherichia coli]|uniref:MFS transporter n=1 Tax=Escherichia coli TaxID=562 RepID=UPI002FBE6E80